MTQMLMSVLRITEAAVHRLTVQTYLEHTTVLASKDILAMDSTAP